MFLVCDKIMCDKRYKIPLFKNLNKNIWPFKSDFSVSHAPQPNINVDFSKKLKIIGDIHAKENIFLVYLMIDKQFSICINWIIQKKVGAHARKHYSEWLESMP